VCFRGGPPSEELELQLSRKTGLGGTERLSITARGDRVSYSGAPRKTHGEELLVGVRKKGSDKVRLLRLTPPFAMETAVVDPELLSESAASHAAASAVSVSAREGKEVLVAQLGSEKARKRLQRAANKVVKHDLVLGGEQVNAMVRSALEAASEGASSALTEQEKRPAHPRFDLSAATAREAYPREGLVPDAAWAAMDAGRLDMAARSTDQLAAMERDQARRWPAVVLRVLRTGLPATGRASSSTSRPTERSDVLRALLYLTYMCRFYTIKRGIAPAPGGSGDAPEEEVHPMAGKLGLPSAAWRELLAGFAETQAGAAADDAGATRRLTERTKQKLAMHAMALALWVGEGKGDSAEMAQVGATKRYRPRSSFLLRLRQPIPLQLRRLFPLRLARHPPRQRTSCSPPASLAAESRPASPHFLTAPPRFPARLAAADAVADPEAGWALLAPAGLRDGQDARLNRCRAHRAARAPAR
jgi:hypothetical protein